MALMRLFDRARVDGRFRVGFRMPAGRERLNRVRGRRPKASDERTRGKAVSAWRAMGIWRRSGCGGRWFSEDCRGLEAADDRELTAAVVLDGLIEDRSVMS